MNRKDIGLVLVILLLAGGLYLLFGRSQAGNAVVITVDGQEYGRYSLAEEQEIEVRTEYGYNHIVIEKGEVFVEDANCPDKYCVKQGKTKDRNKSLVCLPHKLVVEVEAKANEPLDAIVQ